MIYGYENALTIFLLLISIIIVFSAQWKINSTHRKLRKVKIKRNISGQEVARIILDTNGLSDIHIVATRGELTDHYDPSRKVVRLSKSIFDGEDIAAVSVAAHEVGHAIQDKENYVFMKIRSFLVPVVNFISYLGYFALFISIFAGITGYIRVSIFIVLATLLFQIVTLPVEFNASKRAEKELVKLNLIDNSELVQVKSMLSAAAMTYVASMASTLITLLRLVLMARDDD